MPTEQNLIGEWREIGWADLDYTFAHEKNFYNENGSQNDDKSFTMIRWSNQEDPLSGRNVFSAEFLNYGKNDADQGPYESSIDPISKSAVESKFGYNDGELTASFLRYDCRVFPNDNERLVCGLTLKLNPSEKIVMDPSQQKFDNVMGGITLLKRVRK